MTQEATNPNNATKMSFETELLQLFDNAEDVTDTIWYGRLTTLYEEIVWLHDRYSEKQS